LALRGEDYSKRRSNPTDYLLGGLLKCGRCGKRYGGTAAHGKRQRYRYYTCLSRQRSGAHGCDADRLPAEILDNSILDALVETYTNTEIISEALHEARVQADSERPMLAGELAKVEAEIRKTEDARERYFLAFESGAMSEHECGTRVRTLAEKLTELQCRASELRESTASEPYSLPTDEELAALGSQIRDRLENGTPQERKGLIQSLLADVVVERRDEIYPSFRVPDGVRVVYGVVDPKGLEHVTRSSR
jgi:site-specific DNA recombinase